MNMKLYTLASFIILFPLTVSASVGYEILDNGTIYHLWNENDHYYISENMSQITNHYQEYWSYDYWYGCIQYGTWVCKPTTDFNLTTIPMTDNETYVNLTANITIEGGYYQVTYNLISQDTMINVYQYFRNDDIVGNVRFGWLWNITKIRINATEDYDYMFLRIANHTIINGTEFNYSIDYFPLNETQNRVYDFSSLWNGKIDILDREFKGQQPTESAINIEINNTLDGTVTISSEPNTENESISIFTDLGRISRGEERTIKTRWFDSETRQSCPCSFCYVQMFTNISIIYPIANHPYGLGCVFQCVFECGEECYLYFDHYPFTAQTSINNNFPSSFNRSVAKFVYPQSNPEQHAIASYIVYRNISCGGRADKTLGLGCGLGTTPKTSTNYICVDTEYPTPILQFPEDYYNSTNTNLTVGIACQDNVQVRNMSINDENDTVLQNWSFSEYYKHLYEQRNYTFENQSLGTYNFTVHCWDFNLSYPNVVAQKENSTTYWYSIIVKIIEKHIMILTGKLYNYIGSSIAFMSTIPSMVIR